VALLHRGRDVDYASLGQNTGQYFAGAQRLEKNKLHKEPPGMDFAETVSNLM
jgi:hypothetical protein